MTSAGTARVFVTAPAGNIGGRALARLAEGGTPTSALALAADVERLPAAARATTDIHVGTLASAADVTAASSGAAAMLLVLPPVFDDDDAIGVSDRFVDSALAAIEANAIEHVVFVSTQGAGSSPAGLVRSSYVAEQRLAQAAPNVRALRPGPLMENLLNEIVPISGGALPLVATSDSGLHLIAAGDVGDVAAELLLDLSWSGFEAVSMRGPEILTPPEIAERISKAIGRDVAFAQITAAEIIEEMLAFGIARGGAEAYAEVMVEALEDDGYDFGDELVTETTLDAFARTRLAPALAAFEGKTAE